MEKFLKSGKLDARITLYPTSTNTAHIDAPSKELKPIEIRAIRYVDKDGKVSVLLTDLLANDVFSTDELRRLYRDRWEVEINFRHEKCSFDSEIFHSKSVNGILQEFYAIGFMSIITRLLMVCLNKEKHEALPRQKCAPQFKNAMKAITADVAIFVSHNPEITLKIFDEVINEIN